MKSLWKLVSAMESFECKDIKAVVADLDKKDAKIKVLTDELERVYLLAGIKVVFVAVIDATSVFLNSFLTGLCESGHGC